MTDQEIGNLIRQRRIDLGYTGTYVANYLGVNKSTLSRWESGQIRTIRRPYIAKLADILAIPPDVFVGKDPVDLDPAEIVLERKKIVDRVTNIKDVAQLKSINKFIDAFIIEK